VPALPPQPGVTDEGQRSERLIHPFEDFRLNNPLQSECDPGSCPTGEKCLVNRCVDEGFIDPTADRGFRERREFFLGGGYYGVDLLWERIKTGP
jgi:hypothetical protein